MHAQITPVILSYNEQANIHRTLTALSWAGEVLVLDSFSDDATLAICKRFTNVRIVQRKFDNFANQCNFALAQGVNTPWVLSMDADYVITDALIKELAMLTPPVNVNGYQISFDYLIDGKTLRGSLYPKRTALYRLHTAHYQQDGHAHRVQIDGKIERLIGKIQHDDRKPYKRWLNAQRNYATQEAAKLKQTAWSALSAPDKLRKLGVAPLVVIPYTLIIKALLLDGQAGLRYAAQRFVAEYQLQIARFKLATGKG